MSPVSFKAGYFYTLVKNLIYFLICVYSCGSLDVGNYPSTPCIHQLILRIESLPLL